MHTIIKTAISSILLLLLSSTIFAQNAYRSNAATMNWNTATNWEEFSGGIWITAGAAPTSASGAIEIRSGHTVTITATVTVDQVTVNGTLSLNSGITLTLNSGAGDEILINVGGVFNNSGTLQQNILPGRVVKVFGTYNMLEGGVVSNAASNENLFESGSTYNHKYTVTPGTIPQATWKTGSNCMVTGYTTNSIAPGGLSGVSFYNFTWNLDDLNVSGAFELSGQPSNIAGNYTISSTGLNGDYIVLNNPSSTIASINVGGNFEVTGTSTVIITLEPTSSTSINSGAIALTDANAFLLFGGGDGTITLTGNLNLSAGEFYGGTGISKVILAGSTAQSYTSGCVVFDNIDFEVNNNSILSLSGSNYIGGASWGGTLTIRALGTIRTGSIDASGVIQAANAGAIWSGTRVFETGATLELNGSAGQFLGGSATPININVVINNASGVALNNNWTLGTNRTLTFTTGKLKINDKVLTLNGSVSGMSASNSITGGSTSVITIGGNGSAGTLFFDQTTDGTTNVIKQLTLNRSGGSTTLGNKLVIPVSLNVTSGTFNTGDFLTLRSTASLTAQVAAVTGTISGQANIERFIPSIARRWRFLSAPVSSGASIANSWRNGMFITGTGTGFGPVGLANYNSNGFDWTAANSASIYTYNENQALDFNSRWVAVTSAATTLNRGVGYRVFIRGDRSNAGRLDGSVTTQNEVTITAVGAIPQGAINVPITCSNGCTADDGWNLVGNPYPATVDWNTLQSSNSSKVTGSYTVINPATNAYESWNGTTGDATRYISSGQSFWVKSLLSSTNLSFAESHKDIAQVGGSKFKSSGLTNHLKITLSGNGFYNNAFIHQNTTGAYGKDNYDAVKFGYGNYQIATFEPSTGTRMDINNLPVYGAKVTDTIEVEVNVPVNAANYQLAFNDPSSFTSNLKVYLQDKFLNTIQDLNLANTYSFATNGTAGSTGNRFRILITDQTTPLPVVFTALEAKLNSNNGTDLKWSTMSEKNNAKFIVERSVDMKSFVEIGLVKAVGNSNVRNNYTYTDLKPAAYTTNYYRIKQVDLDGKFTYSNIASITTDIKGNGNINTIETTTNAVKVYPIPTRDVLNISMVDGDDLTYSIVDVFGSEVKKGASEVIETASSINVSELSSGIYFIVVKSSNGTLTKTKFIVE